MDMLEDFLAAGYRAVDFWGLSPRLYLAHMRAARRRVGEGQAAAAEAAFVGARSSERGLQRFVAAVTGRDNAMPPEALDGMIRSASAGMQVISMAEYLKRREQ
ncbi:hypothetical protein [Marinibacterium sp. SX1]|uniref:hypothetical protein n=1 Tax=Marinibacterium sp. SX1 TaxID=3388424 RepID=UPI003D17EE75